MNLFLYRFLCRETFSKAADKPTGRLQKKIGLIENQVGAISSSNLYICPPKAMAIG